MARSDRRVRGVEWDIGSPETVVGVPVRQQHSATQRSAVNVNDIWAMVVAISRAPFDQRPRGCSQLFSISISDPHLPNWAMPERALEQEDRKRVVKGKSVSVRVALGCRRIIKQIHDKTIMYVVYLRHDSPI